MTPHPCTVAGQAASTNGRTGIANAESVSPVAARNDVPVQLDLPLASVGEWVQRICPSAVSQHASVFAVVPDEESVRHLRRLSVDYLLLHREYLGEERYVGLMEHLTRNAAFVGPWTFGAGLATIQVFRLRDRGRADESH